MNDRNKRLAKKSFIYFIGNLSSRILNFLLVPLYAYTVSTNDLGNYDYVITLANIIVPIVYMNIWEAILKFFLSKDDEKEKIISTSIFFVFLVTLLFVLGATCLFQIYSFVAENSFLVTAIFVVFGLTTLWQYYARSINAEKIYVASSIISTIINLILNIVLICVCHMGFKGLAISYIVANLMSVIIIEFKIKMFSKFKIRKVECSLLKKMLVFSAPLVLNTISAWLLNGSSKVIIVQFLGSTENGLYAFANKFSVIVTLFGTVINMAFVEESIINSQKGKVDSYFLNTVENLFYYFINLLIIFIPIINIFYSIISTTEYFASRVYFPFLLLYALFSVLSTNIGTIFHVVNKTKYAFLTTIIGAIFFLLICFLGINSIGLYAVAIAQIIGAFVMFLLRYLFTKKYVSDTFKWSKWLILLLIFLGTSWVSYNLNLIYNIILLGLILLLEFYINRSMVLNLLKKFKIIMFKASK